MTSPPFTLEESESAYGRALIVHLPMCCANCTHWKRENEASGECRSGFSARIGMVFAPGTKWVITRADFGCRNWSG